MSLGDRVYIEIALHENLGTSLKSIVVWINRNHSTLRALETVCQYAELTNFLVDLKQQEDSDDTLKLDLFSKDNTILPRKTLIQELIQQNLVHDCGSLLLKLH